MWRAFFFAAGTYACLLGAQCLVVEKAIMARGADTQQRGSLGLNLPSATARGKEMTPPDWAPWSLLSLGAVTLLYSFTLNRSGGK